MPPPAKITERKTYLPLLWDVFLQKIDDDWSQKYCHLGSDINSVELDILLADEVHKDMVKEAISLGIKESSVLSSQTLHQYMENGGFPIKIKANNLQLLLRYCGYPDWADFKKNVEHDAPSSDGQKSKKKNDNSFRNPLFYFGPVILVLLLFSFALN